MNWLGDRCVYSIAALSPPLTLRLSLRDFKFRVKAAFVIALYRLFRRAHDISLLRLCIELPSMKAQLRTPSDIAEFREFPSQRLRFDPRMRGLTTYAFAQYTTVYEARRWA